MALDDVLSRIADSLEKIAERMGSPAVPQECRYTLFAWIDEWFETYRVPILKDHGYDLRNNINKHVKPNIENKLLNAYTAHDIVKALGLVKSERMRQITRQIYNQAFREAVRAGYIERNPVDNVDNVKHTYINGHAMTVDEQTEFLRTVADDDYNALYCFYLLTGARPSEPLAVTWQDVGADTIRIAGTKTKLSDRFLPLSRELRVLLDTMSHDGERLFPYSYQTINKHFKSIVLSKLTFKITLKDLRHTFATRCAESGVHMRTLQKWMGHSKLETTATYYTHILSEFERSEIERLDVRKSTT